MKFFTIILTIIALTLALRDCSGLNKLESCFVSCVEDGSKDFENSNPCLLASYDVEKYYECLCPLGDGWFELFSKCRKECNTENLTVNLNPAEMRKYICGGYREGLDDNGYDAAVSAIEEEATEPGEYMISGTFNGEPWYDCHIIEGSDDYTNDTVTTKTTANNAQSLGVSFISFLAIVLL